MAITLYGQAGSDNKIQIGATTKTGSNIGNALGFGIIEDINLNLTSALLAPVSAAATPSVEILNPLAFQKINEYQNATFISSDRYISVQQLLNNVKYTSSGFADAYSNNGFGYAEIEVNYIPNSLAQFNLRFTDSTARSVSSCKIYISDSYSTGTSTANFNIQWYECVHLSSSVTAAGSGLNNWSYIPASSTGSIILRTSPGISGLNPTGSSSSSTQHDWYFCTSFTPAKTFYGTSMNISCMIEYV